MRKLLFFDIDGTLVDADGSILPSTIQAIHAAQDAGHWTFINTGRTWGNVDVELRQIGFDGYICGCGTEIRYQNQVLLRQKVDPALCIQMRNLVRTCHATPLYESSETMFYDSTTPVLPAFTELMQIYERKHASVQDLVSDPTFGFDKFVIWYDANTDLQMFQKGIAPFFDYIDRGTGFAEMVPHGYSKATGMQYLLDHLHMEQKDTIAFGDSLNDLPMMQAAAIAVGMGNGTALHPYVTFITKDIKENGISYAMKQLDLLSLSE